MKSTAEQTTQLTSSSPSSSSFEKEEDEKEAQRISVTLANDRPTIDGAVKSFCSLVCARSMTASMTDQTVLPSRLEVDDTLVSKMAGVTTATTNTTSTSTSTPQLQVQQSQQTLQVARIILQTCNSFEFPIHKTVAHVLQDKPGLTMETKQGLLELSVVARLWNGLIQSKQKPTRFLGRKALLHAWADLDVASALSRPSEDSNNAEDETTKTIYLQQLALLQEFERYLLQPRDANSMVDDDAALIWDSDGGQAELARRRERRKSAATERGPVTPS